MPKRKRPNLTTRKPKAKSNANKNTGKWASSRNENNALEETQTSVSEPIYDSLSQLILLSQSTETQPSTSENESHLQSVSTESPTTSQPVPICESIDLQSATLQDISDVFEPEVSDNNFVTQDVNISTDNIAGKNDNEVVCIFCNKKKKKMRSRMLPLHAADVQQFKDSVKPNIESHKEFTDFSNKLDNFSGSKIYYHTECRVDFNNKLSSLKATPSKKEWHYHREYHQFLMKLVQSLTFIRPSGVQVYTRVIIL
ncbi:hypothetical protein WA026_019516 [Henosepilachna vigintioctopunctata]|uniref:Uncharacterized protein n=1 Tax=Henosepilachna vigintioctopunctata TaxID=420089 RepID=A0AAW1TY08_9CUCU